MKHLVTVIALSVILGAPVWADTKTVTLFVPGMTCSTCPITISKALKKISGVEKIDIRFEQRQAVVTYDDAKTNVQALIKATTEAGYPFEEKQGK